MNDSNRTTSDPQATFCSCPRCKCHVEESSCIRDGDKCYCSEACARGHDLGLECPAPDCQCHAAA
ncbi:MAG: hypothetical protein KDD69_15610 [Bdellovibrionales bacterium]|nr:hypothetical protein [Bdellovibrionales bacterium]